MTGIVILALATIPIIGLAGQQKAAAGLRGSAAASHFGRDTQPAVSMPCSCEKFISSFAAQNVT
jgi:hypothetical protein